MSIFRNTSVADFTRGGQTTIHFIRMIYQVFKESLRLCLILLLLIFAVTYWYKTDPVVREMTWGYGEAWVKFQFLRIEDSSVRVTLPGRSPVNVSSRVALTHQSFRRALQESYQACLWGVSFGIVGVVAGIFLGGRFIQRTGKGFASEEHIRGATLTDKAQLVKVLKTRAETSGMTIADIPIPTDSEPAHFLFAGSPGTGKSTAYKEMLLTIRKRNERAIVYDTSGDLVESFYREGKDIILNPFDERCENWLIWNECLHEYHIDDIASALIPEPKRGSDPFWTNGSRIVFTSVIKKLEKAGRCTNYDFVNTFLKMDFDQFMAFLEGTDAQSIFDKKSEKTASSIRSVLATYVRPVKYMDSGSTPFSIREWVQDDADDRWVFISAKGDQKEIIRPLASVWLDVASSAILSLAPDRQRRLWVLLDELASLNRLPTLLESLSQSRKFGGCYVLGVQSYPQLVGVYGRDDADALAGSCSTWSVFRFNEERSAEWASKGLGSAEQIEPDENISYGINDIRDGVSLSKRRQLRPIVLSTEILYLEDLTGYLKLGRQYPVGKFRLGRKKLKKVTEGFIDRKTAQEKDYNGKGFSAANPVVYQDRNMPGPDVMEGPPVEAYEDFMSGKPAKKKAGEAAGRQQTIRFDDPDLI